MAEIYHHTIKQLNGEEFEFPEYIIDELGVDEYGSFHELVDSPHMYHVMQRFTDNEGKGKVWKITVEGGDINGQLVQYWKDQQFYEQQEKTIVKDFNISLLGNSNPFSRTDLIEQEASKLQYDVATVEQSFKVGNEGITVYRTSGGCLIGLDNAFLEQMSDECQVFDPYGSFAPIMLFEESKPDNSIYVLYGSKKAIKAWDQGKDEFDQIKDDEFWESIKYEEKDTKQAIINGSKWEAYSFISFNEFVHLKNTL